MKEECGNCGREYEVSEQAIREGVTLGYCRECTTLSIRGHDEYE
jgi:hypothetical protein